MKLEIMIQQLKDLKNSFENGKSLKLYCESKKISYTSTSRILKRGTKTMELRTAYNILGLTPERNITQGVLSTKIAYLVELKKVFEKGLL